jgi:sodium-dependent dicarboxylate transporter 2/3/5
MVRERNEREDRNKRGFENWRRGLGFVLGPAAGAVLLLLPLPGLTREAHTLAAVIAWVVVWWIGEPVPLPVTALWGAVLCVLTGVAPAKAAFAAFADPMIFLFLGSFLLAEAMSVHGLDRRFAYSLMSMRWIGDRPGRLLFVFGAIAAFISMWISNTATAAMMFPIGLGIIAAMSGPSEKKGDAAVPPSRFAIGMMLMTSYAASAGGIGTPVGTPPNIIGLALIKKFTGVDIPFFRWMLFAVPLLIVMYFILFGLLSLLHRPEPGTLRGGGDFIRRERAALVAGLLLFVLPVDRRKREFTLTWRQALNIDWGTLLLFGGGITLGELMFRTGLADAVGHGLLRLSGASSLWGITLAAVFIAILVSETTSNTASANMVVPVIISLAMAAGVNPVPPAVGATLGASWGFMLPVSTPPNAIIYSSGLVPITKMIRAGVLFDLLGGLTIWVGLRLLLPLVGLA